MVKAWRARAYPWRQDVGSFTAVINCTAYSKTAAAWAEAGGSRPSELAPAKKLLLPEPLKPTMLLCMGLSGPHCVFSRYDLKPWILTYLMYMARFPRLEDWRLRTNPRNKGINA